MVSTKEMIEEISKMQYHLVACAPTPAQYAVQKVFPDRMKFIDELLPVFDRRRRLMTNLLNNIEGFECPMPQGAFYTFPRFSMNMSSKDLARSIVSAGVICSPGIAFGDRGERHMRFSYAASEENIKDGMEIIERVVNGIT